MFCNSIFIRWAASLLQWLGVSTGTAFAQTIEGPVHASVMRVVDGDTLEVEAPIWPQQWVRTFIRVGGIDAPEIRSHLAECEAELARGLRNCWAWTATFCPRKLCCMT